MNNMAAQTKKLATKLENLKQKAKFEKDQAMLLEKTEEVKTLKAINKKKRGTMRKNKVRI